MPLSEVTSLPKNRLLAALPPKDFQRLQPHLQQVSLSIQEVNYESGEPIAFVYFPETAVISLVATLEDGSTIEVGLVGHEGVSGVPLFMGGTTRMHRAFVQVAGDVLRIKAEVLKAEFDRGGALQDLMLRYVQALFSQVSQTAACNRFHTTEERLARWLLIVADAIPAEEFSLTQEFIGQMLGVRRSGVTVAAGNLSQAGLIRYSRGRIVILDRAGLENFSCECYGVIRDEVDRLLRPSLV